MTESFEDDTMPCFVCGADLPVELDVDGPQPVRGVTLATRGHSGSRFYESQGRDVLQLVICDACLIGGREAVQTYDEWEPVVCEEVVVGRLYLERDPRDYDGRVDQSVRVVETDELGDMLDGARRVDWHEAAMDRARALRKARALAERAAQARDEQDEPDAAKREPAKRTRARRPRRQDEAEHSPPAEAPKPVGNDFYEEDESPEAVAALAERVAASGQRTEQPKATPSRIPVAITVPVVPKPGPPRLPPPPTVGEYDPLGDDDALLATTPLDPVERREERERRRAAASAVNGHVER